MYTRVGHIEVLLRTCNDSFELPELFSGFPRGRRGWCPPVGASRNRQCGCVSGFFHSLCKAPDRNFKGEELYLGAHSSSLSLESMMTNFLSVAARTGGEEGLPGLERGAAFSAPPSVACFSSRDPLLSLHSLKMNTQLQS